jgi:hypothetical protein
VKRGGIEIAGDASGPRLWDFWLGYRWERRFAPVPGYYLGY